MRELPTSQRSERDRGHGRGSEGPRELGDSFQSHCVNKKTSFDVLTCTHSHTLSNYHTIKFLTLLSHIYTDTRSHVHTYTTRHTTPHNNTTHWSSFPCFPPLMLFLSSLSISLTAPDEWYDATVPLRRFDDQSERQDRRRATAAFHAKSTGKSCTIRLCWMSATKLLITSFNIFGLRPISVRK